MYSLDIMQPIICSRFGRMVQKNGWERLDYRAIAQNLFVFLISGQADFCVGDAEYHLKPNDILIIPANTSYKAYTSSTCEYYFFHFDGELTPCDYVTLPPVSRRFSFDLSKPVQTVCFPGYLPAVKESARIYKSIVACTEYNARRTRAGQHLLMCEFKKILLTMADITEQIHQPRALPAVLDKMLAYIQKNLTKPVGVPELCAHCGISASYAGRLFRKHLNTTVTEYINDEKLYYACELMNDSGMNISQIAEYLGYCDVFYFSRRFKRKFGKSPSQMFSQLPRY